MRRISGAARLLVLPLIAATIGLSSTAKADRDYCNRTDGKAQGTIIGGVLGAGAGGLIDHGGATGIIAGALGGGLLGRLAGHDQDVQHERRDCGADSEVEQRHERNADAAYDRNQDQQARIDEDRARARYQHDQYEGDRYDRSRYEAPRRPRYQPLFMCVSLGRDRMGERFGIVNTRRNEVVETTGYDYGRCMRHEARWNR